MVAFSWSFALAVLALACSAGALYLAIAKHPLELARQILKQSTALENRWASELALFNAERDRWGLEFNALAERCDETLDRAESKRRRVAATESRQNANAGPAEMTREQIIAAARQRTLGG